MTGDLVLLRRRWKSVQGRRAGKHDRQLNRCGNSVYMPAATGGEGAPLPPCPKLKEIAEIQVEQVTAINSADMTPEIWIKLANRLERVLQEPGISGAVITHGTNTIEETAYFLDLVLTGSKPVVLVGAQRAASDPYSDGPLNFLQAVEVAINAESRGKGCLVVMNGTINAARDVTKLHSNRVETFQSLEFGPLGIVDRMGVKFYRVPLRRQTIPLKGVTSFPRVDIVASYAGVDGQVVRSLITAERRREL